MRVSGPGESALLLLDAVTLLVQQNIRYAVIGAMAASAHGHVRASLDADAVLSLTTQELSLLQNKLKAKGFQTTLRPGDPDDPISSVLTLNDSYGNRVDLIAGLRGMEEAAFSRTIQVPFQGELLQVIGREDFIAMKVFAGSPLDMEDARKAIATGRDVLELTLLKRITANYGPSASENLERLLKPAQASE